MHGVRKGEKTAYRSFPAFLSAHVKEALVEKFGLKAPADVQSDVLAIGEKKRHPLGEHTWLKKRLI